MKTAVKAAYKVEAAPNLAECVLKNDTIKYVDFSTNKETTPLEHPVVAAQISKEDTEKLAGKEVPIDEFASDEGNFTSFMPRSKIDLTEYQFEETKDENGIANEMSDIDVFLHGDPKAKKPVGVIHATEKGEKETKAKRVTKKKQTPKKK